MRSSTGSNPSRDDEDLEPMACFPEESPRALTDADSLPLRWSVHGVDDPRRAEVESFVRRVYARRFGARVPQFAPVLVSLGDAAGIAAAAGYRVARLGPLFLERYLDAPIESVLARHAGRAPARERIVEVGHLAASRPGAGRRLIGLLGPYLAGLGCDWVASTVTIELRRLFARLGITPLALGAADPALLGSDAACWGSYYAHRPVVLADRLSRVLPRLARHRTPASDGR
jgi:hypothetical protein